MRIRDPLSPRALEKKRRIRDPTVHYLLKERYGLTRPTSPERRALSEKARAKVLNHLNGSCDDIIVFDENDGDAERKAEFYEQRRQAIAFLFALLGSPKKDKWEESGVVDSIMAV